MNKPRGFTLLEVMVVVAIVAILASIAAPSFKQMIQSMAISSSVNSFLSDMRYARSESMKRGGGVVMCRSDDPEASPPTCGTGSGPNGKGWVSGWIIYLDQDNNGTIDSTDLLRVQGPITTVNSIVDKSSTVKNKFTFTGTGRLHAFGNSTTLQFGGNPTFANTVQRIICINVGGRARVAGDGLANC